MLLTDFTDCPLCKSSKIFELKDYSKSFLMRCGDCSFVFTRKNPSIEELITHYGNYPRGYVISEITIKRYHELLDKLEPYRKTNNLIDVGCGDGFFLDVAKKRNWNVFGTEFTDEAVKLCSDKGITMKLGKLNPSNYPAGFFDVITSFEVLEHINYPQEELSNFYQILRTNGVVYVTTPNFNSISRYFLKSKWNIIEYPEHLSYFTKKTLSSLFEKHNFKLVEFQSTGISLSRISGNLETFTQKPTIGFSKDENLRAETEKRPILKLAKKFINMLLTLFNAGDTLKGTFVKK